MESASALTKPCHNCRRQRLRCDRSYPRCNKCVAAGKECLGYGKLFRWTGAVASRGKLAGRTSSAPLDAAPPMARAAKSLPPPESVMRDSTGPYPGHSTNGLEAHGNGSGNGGARSVELAVSSPWVLVDPIFQHLGPLHRYYLNYFSDRLCKDLVSHDGPDCNPFRSLVPMVACHPLLQHVIVAASAAHMSVLLRSAPAAAPGASPGASPADDGVGSIASRQQLASRAALNDALVAKHKALRLMACALQDIDSAGGDAVLAAALFFVNVELIESGKHGWRAHLAGACRILSLVRHMRVWNSSLRDYLLSDCFIYFILATAFMPASHEAFEFESSQIRLVLSKTSTNSYFCCPPEILEILHAASELSRSDGNESKDGAVVDEAMTLLTRAQAFDVSAWAANVQDVTQLRGAFVVSRGFAGLAHRSAACLYILQAIPAVGDKFESGLGASLSEEIYSQLSSIPDDDPNFKATSWPTFIAGAEAADPERRAWIMDRLRRLVSQCPWGFIYTAMDTLPILWKLADREGSASWVQILKDPDLNFLIV